MKSALCAVALLVGSAAVAQTDTQTTTTTTTTSTSMSAPQVMAPANTAPERDARGIPVVSDPATAPPGFNQPPSVGGTGASPSAPPAPQPATENYPVCSRTVTDHCVQAYERGVSRPG
ncbi:MAG TPA: hypothetical protein VGX37_12270 [Allosphingosinicella sp.]|nr:hypothetical protein [Allosphingosinicella sp.]